MNITHASPLDVSAVRDSGMQSLIILAASLGWNVNQKINQPVIITARDGTQKRLPTNTSIRMGVFQSALSMVLAHTEEDYSPTPQLIDAIIATTKPSAEHARRLRIAVGESVTQHRDRVAAHAAESKGAREPEPLTQRIVVPDLSMAPARAVSVDFVEPPADGGQHGILLSSEPFQAVRQAHPHRVHTYTSDTSYERIWEDGFKDYACQACGRIFLTPKGVGSHSQSHGKRMKPSWQRARQAGSAETIVEHIQPPTLPEEEPEEVEVLPPVAVEPIEPPLTDEEWQPFAEATGIMPAIDTDPLFVLGQITALLAPELVEEVRRLRAEVEALTSQRDHAYEERDAMVANMQALKEMVGGL